MPEGDSYAYAARRIIPILVGEPVTAVEGSSPAVRRRADAILGQTVESVRTRGKHLLIDLASGLSIHVHLGMSGRVLTTRPEGVPPGQRGAVRLGLRSPRGAVWVAGAPTVEVGRRREIDASLHHLGPDLLAPEFDMELFLARAGAYPPGRPVSDLLLDQRVMAGVGNEYKSEVLFLEGVDPRRETGSLDESQLRNLAGRSRRLLAPNAGRGRRSTTGRPDGSLWVYGRRGRPCRRCRSPIQADWVGDPPRITYWCPRCQA